MKKRSKQNIKYWQERRNRLYKELPSSRLVQNRYIALEALMREKYPNITKYKDIHQFMKDFDYLNRRIRRETDGEQVLEKKILSQEYQLKELNK